MKIKVPKFFVNEDTLSYSKTKKIADIFEASSYLDSENKIFKKKYNLPINGLPLKTQKDFLILSDKIGEIADMGLIEDCNRIADKLGLPSFWSNSLINILICNTFMPPEKDDFRVLATSKFGTTTDPFSIDAWAMNHDSMDNLFADLIEEQAVLLAIRRKMSKTELKKLIDENWNHIESGMSELPTVKFHQMQRLTLAQQIVELRDNQNFKFREIADHLAKTQYQDDLEIHDLLTEDYVKNLYSRWKKKSKKVSST